MLDTVDPVNRRAAYRVSPIAVDDLRLKLRDDAGEFEVLAIEDVSFRGASVLLGADVAERAASGTELSISITSKFLDTNFDVPARIVSTEQHGTETLVAIAFKQSLAAGEGGRQAFFKLFNRRSAVRAIRVGQEAGVAAAIMIQDNDATRTVGVRNLSVNGIGLSVDAATDAALRGQSSIKIQLLLPDSDEPFDIAAAVTFRRDLQDAELDVAAYGCRFNWEDTPEPERLAELLESFILEQIERDFRSVAH